MINNIVWRPITGYKNLYLISNNGKVFSLVTNKILKQSKTTTGYMKVELYKNKNRKSFKIHRLVAAEFVENPTKMVIVNHLDGNPLNNNFDNLEWCDQKRNTQHAYDNGLRYSRLHEYKNQLIYEYSNTRISLRKLANKYSVSAKSLSNLLTKNGIKVRSISESKNIYRINKKEMVKMFETGANNSEIAEYFKTNKKLIATYRCKYKKGVARA